MKGPVKFPIASPFVHTWPCGFGSKRLGRARTSKYPHDEGRGGMRHSQILSFLHPRENGGPGHFDQTASLLAHLFEEVNNNHKS